MSDSARPEVAVVGAGPAGLCAAAAAAEAGARVVLYDENARAGGQLFKQIHRFFGAERHFAGVRGYEIGRKLVARVEAAGVEVRLETVVFGIYDGLRLGVYPSGGRVEYVRPERLILALGASERGLAFPGWTLPGVMGAGAAQTLMNMHRVLPGHRALVVGAGNVGLIVAYQFLQAGGQVCAVVDAAPHIGGYEVHAAKLRREGVPVLVEHTVVRAEGEGTVQSATIAALSPDGGHIPGTERTLEVDTVLLAVGLTPQVELARMAGCEVMWRPALGGHVVRRDTETRTTVPEVFVAGDLGGIREASTAMEEGAIAGLTSAVDLGYLPADRGASLRAEHIELLAELTAETRRPLCCLPDYAVMNRARRPLAVIECHQRIPCNPCETACPAGAITVGDDINGLPALDPRKCNGCGQCLRQCPGLAIFVVQAETSPGRSLVTMPFELPHLPETGQVVHGLDREGNAVCEARISSVRPGRNPGDTALVTVDVPTQFAHSVRAFRRIVP